MISYAKNAEVTRRHWYPQKHSMPGAEQTVATSFVWIEKVSNCLDSKDTFPGYDVSTAVEVVGTLSYRDACLHTCQFYLLEMFC